MTHIGGIELWVSVSLEKPLLILGVSLALTICELRTTMAQLGGGSALTVCELRTTIAQLGGGGVI